MTKERKKTAFCICALKESTVETGLNGGNPYLNKMLPIVTTRWRYLHSISSVQYPASLLSFFIFMHSLFFLFYFFFKKLHNYVNNTKGNGYNLSSILFT